MASAVYAHCAQLDGGRSLVGHLELLPDVRVPGRTTAPGVATCPFLGIPAEDATCFCVFKFLQSEVCGVPAFFSSKAIF